MPFLSFLALFLLGLTVVATVRAVVSNYRWYWVAALASWVLSFLTGFSIGLYVFSVTVVVTLLALGHAAGVIRRPWQALLGVVGGLAVWALLIDNVDDYWFFFPISRIFDVLF